MINDKNGSLHKWINGVYGEWAYMGGGVERGYLDIRYFLGGVISDI